MDYFNDTWKVLDKYFQTEYFLTNHHIDSYNDFVENKFKNTIKVLNPFVNIKDEYRISVYIGGINGDKITTKKHTYNDKNILPNIARLYNLTYSFSIYTDILVRYEKINGKDYELVKDVMFDNYRIGSIPIMLHSSMCILSNKPKEDLRELGECVYDQGGYFIIDGKEKVIVAQERIVTNRIFINPSKDPAYSYQALIRCIAEDKPLFPKTLNVFVNHKDKKNNPNSILITVPGFRDTKIPVFVLFKAFGIESDKKIIELINPDDNPSVIEFLRYSIVHCGNLGVFNQKDAFNYLTGYTDYNNIVKTKYVLIDDLFPNMGENFRNKALFLGLMMNKLIKVVLEIKKPSDRDNYIYKRVDTSGFLISNLFTKYYNQFRNIIRKHIDRQYYYGPWKNSGSIAELVNDGNMKYIFQTSIIEDGFKKSLKGNFGVSMVEDDNDDDSKKEIVQDLNRISYLSFMSHLRRVNTPLDPTAKVVAPHRLHPSQWGIICPCESPDGGSIGLLKNFAIMTRITFDNNSKYIIDCLNDNNLISLFMSNDEIIKNYTKIFVNGSFVGFHEKPNQLFRILKLLKRNSYINIYTSISWHIFDNEIIILTEAGRCCRPLYVVYNNKLLIEDYFKDKKKIEWDSLINKNNNHLLDHYVNPFSIGKTIEDLEKEQCPIEYIDVEETNCSKIAMYPSWKYTVDYCEIHPSTIFGILTHNIPLANYNQAPRNIFSGAQGKQAIGCYATNFNDRIDTMAYVMDYPQKCLLNTRYCEYLNLNHLPNGQNLILAFMTYSGYNMEDAIIINKSSIERGLFNITYYKNIIETEEKTKNQEEVILFNNPHNIIDQGLNLQQIKWADYSKLDSNGMPKLNTFIKENDAIIGKTKITTIVKENKDSIFSEQIKEEIYSDRSLIADKTISGKIDKVFVFKNDEDLNVAKIRFRKARVPELGDKACSRMAQKGIIGGIIPIENMPYTKDGIVPDIIINPHAIPSRMTMAHLLEMLIGKYACIKGTTVDGTPFNNNNYDSLYDELETHGYEKHGNEILYNGLTGDQIDCKIFIGPIFYERLKHMTQDKINYRQLDIATIQNLENKPEILKTSQVNVLTHQPVKGRGNNGALRIGEMERDSILSHGSIQFLKESLMERSDKYQWKYQDINDNLMNIETPYAFKQFVHEVNALGVDMKFSKEEIHEDDYEDDQSGNEEYENEDERLI